MYDLEPHNIFRKVSGPLRAPVLQGFSRWSVPPEGAGPLGLLASQTLSAPRL
jgi:hypothetical protein